MRPGIKPILLLAFASMTGACAQNVAKTPVPIGGSRADAAIEMAYQVGLFEKPVVDWTAAEDAASRRCRQWGYARAEGYEGVRTRCDVSDGYGTCLRTTVIRTYQCLE
ncbi:YecR family lipoprotein [Oceanicella actignis]|uniref:YecR-like lipoprotein n=1 Tax=Oceanicella actignis TaxID=1189325 RepID=A0A1M7TFF3_9RHOB|nr:YecR family lipoprotein [Oceanicella actignis]TYO88553.1 YecR-like lipoprotein [Oceanicella actignis]SET61276.1 YecR-like lipoprotein [Oceanicella actignis]SHN69393.1 YecR-like lipoprotein [Oceanicella actignis]